MHDSGGWVTVADSTTTHSTAVHRAILAESRRLRLVTLCVLYIAQGVPIGLFWFAIPAWMAANGASAADVGYVLGLTALPWTLKLVNGFIMDRYTWLAMGRRRIWIIGAQVSMIGLLVAGAIVRPQAGDIVLLGMLGFLVNMATTFQDVAVDGLAVDITHEDERARASGMMFGGQSIGIAMATAMTGMAIARFGPSAAYLLAAGFIALVTLYVLWLRERPGERRLPWSEGQAHARNLAVKLDAWSPIICTSFRAMIVPVSLLWLPVLLARGFHYGVFTGATPLIATGDVGWDEEATTRLVGTAQFVGGIIGLTIGGWVGDRLGAKRSTILVLAGFLVLTTLMLAGTAHWKDPGLFKLFVFAWVSFDVLLAVVSLPISMRLCSPSVAATQFTLYMATSNLGISLGAAALGLSGTLGGLPPVFGLVFAAHLLGLVLMLVVKYPGPAPADASAGLAPAQEPAPIPVHN